MSNRDIGHLAQGPACGKYCGSSRFQTSWSTLRCTAHGEQGRRRAAAQQHSALQMTEEGRVVSVPCSTRRRNANTSGSRAVYKGGLQLMDESGMKGGRTHIKAPWVPNIAYFGVMVRRTHCTSHGTGQNGESRSPGAGGGGGGYCENNLKNGQHSSKSLKPMAALGPQRFRTAPHAYCAPPPKLPNMVRANANILHGPQGPPQSTPISP